GECVPGPDRLQRGAGSGRRAGDGGGRRGRFPVGSRSFAAAPLRPGPQGVRVRGWQRMAFLVAPWRGWRGWRGLGPPRRRPQGPAARPPGYLPTEDRPGGRRAGLVLGAGYHLALSRLWRVAGWLSAGPPSAWRCSPPWREVPDVSGREGRCLGNAAGP